MEFLLQQPSSSEKHRIKYNTIKYKVLMKTKIDPKVNAKVNAKVKTNRANKTDSINNIVAKYQHFTVY